MTTYSVDVEGHVNLLHTKTLVDFNVYNVIRGFTHLPKIIDICD